jgi:hypothetical protein
MYCRAGTTGIFGRWVSIYCNTLAAAVCWGAGVRRGARRAASPSNLQILAKKKCAAFFARACGTLLRFS